MTVAKKTTKRSAKKPAADKKNGASFKQAILDHLKITLAHAPTSATLRDWWICVSLAVRDRIVEDMIETQAVHHSSNTRRIYYLSLEFLMGRMLTNNL